MCAEESTAKQTPTKEHGFSFSIRGIRFSVYWDGLQYILTATSKKRKKVSYYTGIYQMLTELISSLPMSSTAGSLHEFTADVTDCMEQIRKLGKYIEANFVPKTDLEMQKTAWGVKLKKAKESSKS